MLCSKGWTIPQFSFSSTQWDLVSAPTTLTATMNTTNDLFVKTNTHF